MAQSKYIQSVLDAAKGRPKSTEWYKDKIKEFEKKYPDQNNVPRPPHWSGWRVLPNEIEFWLDGDNRIHQRLKYLKSGNKSWKKVLLSP